MWPFDSFLTWTVLLCTLFMGSALLKAVACGSHALAAGAVEHRRNIEETRRAEDAKAHALSRIAALEPLALNPDGSVEEPILGIVETR